MTDKELADKVIALGVGNNTHDLYAFGAYHVIGCTFTDFVRDWQVAGALMEKCDDVEIGSLSGDSWAVICNDQSSTQAWNKSLPRAIIEACVEALS